MDDKERVFTTNFVHGRAVTGVTWLAPKTPGPLSSSLLSLSYPHNSIRYLLSLLHVFALSLYPVCSQSRVKSFFPPKPPLLLRPDISVQDSDRSCALKSNK